MFYYAFNQLEFALTAAILLLSHSKSVLQPQARMKAVKDYLLLAEEHSIFSRSLMPKAILPLNSLSLICRYAPLRLRSLVT